MTADFDEHRHEPVGDDWQERWTFEAWDEDGTFGAVAAVTLVPHHRHAWYWAAVVREGHPLLTLVDTELRLPSTSLALRGEGLWADHVCETPLEHWTIANEAFSVALDDPDEALGAQRGVLVPLGFDLEWEAAADPVGAATGYSIEATVNGEILIADGGLSIDATGRWRHEWGRLEWPTPPMPMPHGLRAPLRIDTPPGGQTLVERVVNSDGWHEWLRGEPGP
jgi:hypothetical protein